MNISATIQNYLNQGVEFASANWASFKDFSPTIADVIEKVAQVATHRFSLILMTGAALTKVIKLEPKGTSLTEPSSLFPYTVSYRKNTYKPYLALALACFSGAVYKSL